MYKTWELIVLLVINLMYWAACMWLAIYKVVPAVQANDYSKATFYMVAALAIAQLIGGDKK